ncbi:MAG: ABC transporter permease [Bdellovibrio sp.]|nr:ABC transporter permease [Bdellovibrio sp.]
MRQLWFLALRNLGRNTRRNIATGSAIALGFAGILLLGGYVHRVSNYLRVYTVYVMHTGHMAMFARDGFEKFQYQPRKFSISNSAQIAIEQALKNETQVDFSERQLSGAGLIGNGRISIPFFAQGYEPSIDQRLQSNPEVLRWINKDGYFSKGKGLWNYSEDIGALALSGGLALRLGKKLVYDEGGDANVQLISGTWQGALNAIDAEVVAHFNTGFRESDFSAIYIGYKRLQQLFDTESVGRYSIWLKDPGQVKKVAKRLTSKLKDSGIDVEVLAWDEERLSPYYTGTMQFLNSLVTFIGIVLASIISFSVLNSTTMTVVERLQEIGMYRSVGFRRSQVSRLFVNESCWLAIVSLIVGAVLGYISIYSINAAKIIYYPPGVPDGLQLRLVASTPFLFKSGAIILLLTLLTTYFAVRRTLRMRVADLLGGIRR